MCKIMEDALEQEAKESREKTMVECIKNLMEEMKLTSEQAMKALRIPQSEQSIYLKMLR